MSGTGIGGVALHASVFGSYISVVSMAQYGSAHGAGGGNCEGSAKPPATKTRGPPATVTTDAEACRRGMLIGAAISHVALTGSKLSADASGMWVALSKPPTTKTRSPAPAS